MNELIHYEARSNAAAIALFEQALASDPAFAQPMSLLALAHANAFRRKWSADPQESRAAFFHWYEQALRAQPIDEAALANLAGARLNLVGPDSETVQLAERAMAMNPDRVGVLFWAAQVDWVCGNLERALERFEKMLRLNPRATQRHLYLSGMGNCLYFLDRYNEAAVVQEEVLRSMPDYPASLLVAALAHHHCGRGTEARALGQRLQELGGLAEALRYFNDKGQRARLQQAWTTLREGAAQGAVLTG